MKIQEIQAKSILSRSQIYDGVINPYVGCAHACSYCYARFMKRFTGHREPWGDFVDVKVNAPDLLEKEIGRKKKGTVWVSGVCDPYQPLEARYELTRECLGILAEHGWPVVIQTRSPLVLRDLDILGKMKDLEAGLSITTASDEVRKAFEPCAPPIPERLRTVASLHEHGIRTYVMIAPLLPEAEKLVGLLAGKVDYLIIDRMNYCHADWVYGKHGWQGMSKDEYFYHMGKRIARDCAELGIECRSAY
jgi:DNA repair photolyase